MYKYDEIKTVHLELSTQCNAHCPMCLHSVMGGPTNPQLPLVSLSLNDIKKIFSQQFLSQLNRIYMCGNYGDPIMAPDCLEVYQYLRSQNKKLRLELFTNGSARSTAWWKDLAQVADHVHFSIDGLEDTNHLYRRGTNFKKIIENMKSYIDCGGRVTWDFIVFKHNEQQIEEAKQLSQDLGVHNFVVKKTGRFFSNQKAQVKDKQEVHNKSGKLEYFLETPQDENFKNSALKKEQLLIDKYGSLNSYLDKTAIHCKVLKEKSIYISAEALVFPCCWTANQLYPWYFKPRSSQMWKQLESLPGGVNSLSAKKYSLQSIIDGPFFKKVLPQSWSCPSIDAGKPRVCAKTCGSEFDPFKAQF